LVSEPVPLFRPPLSRPIPYLLSALPGDPPRSERQREALRQVDLHGAPPYHPAALDGQSAYDRSELTEYLRIKHPQP